MIKKIVLVIAMLFFLYSNQIEKEIISDVKISNIEALAMGESGEVRTCWQVVEWTGSGLSEWVTYCGDCDAILCTYYSKYGQCK